MTVVDPHRLIEALEAADRVQVGHRTGQYVRLARPDHPRASLPVSFDQTAPEYAEDMQPVLRELRDVARLGTAAQAVLDTIGA